MAGDVWNNWAIVQYGDAEEMAGFRDGSLLGWGSATNAIYAALKSAMKNAAARRKGWS
jgi:hypothetical protein